MQADVAKSEMWWYTLVMSGMEVKNVQIFTL